MCLRLYAIFIKKNTTLCYIHQILRPIRSFVSLSRSGCCCCYYCCCVAAAAEKNFSSKDLMRTKRATAAEKSTPKHEQTPKECCRCYRSKQKTEWDVNISKELNIQLSIYLCLLAYERNTLRTTSIPNIDMHARNIDNVIMYKWIISLKQQQQHAKYNKNNYWNYHVCV